MARDYDTLGRLVSRAKAYSEGWRYIWTQARAEQPPLETRLILRRVIHDLQGLDSLVVRTKDVLCSCGTNWHQSLSVDEVATRHPELAGQLAWLVLVLSNVA